MSTSHVTPTMFALSAIEHPRCPLCQLPMPLAGIYPGPRELDFRTFECARCEHSETVLADNVLKSKAAEHDIAAPEPP